MGQRSSRTKGVPRARGAPRALLEPGRLSAISDINVTAYGTICRNACGMNVMFSACRVNGSCSVNPNRIAPAISLIGLQLANTTSANAIQPMPFVVAAWCQAAL